MGWRFGACPRCKGALFVYYRDQECIACGWAGPTTIGTLPDPRPRLPLLIGEVALLAGGEDVGALTYGGE